MDFIGTGNGDSIVGSKGDDSFDMSQGGHDFVDGRGGDDVFLFGAQLFATDTIIGGAGTDTLVLDGPYQLMTRFKPTTMTGIEILQLVGAHSYTLKLDDGNVAAHKVLTVQADIFNGGNLSFDGGQESDGAFLIHGSVEGDAMRGGARADTLDGGKGHDVLRGGGGGDLIIGGAGADHMTGGTGADVFLYAALEDSSLGFKDLILDLTRKDVIDLSAIDADAGQDGDQAFVLVNTLSGHAGQAALGYDEVNDLTTLALDVDGDGQADAAITMSGDHTGFTHFAL